MSKLFDNFEHESNSNLKFVISFRLLNIPTVTLYCTALPSIFKIQRLVRLSLKRRFSGCGHGFGGCDGLGGLSGFNGLGGISGFGGFSGFGGLIGFGRFVF